MLFCRIHFLYIPSHPFFVFLVASILCVFARIYSFRLIIEIVRRNSNTVFILKLLLSPPTSINLHRAHNVYAKVCTMMLTYANTPYSKFSWNKRHLKFMHKFRDKMRLYQIWFAANKAMHRHLDSLLFKFIFFRHFYRFFACSSFVFLH